MTKHVTPKSLRPTAMSYEAVQAAYTHFNKELFNGSLPECLITFQRHARAYGYFAGRRFVQVGRSGKPIDEIALNPKHFGGDRTVAKVLSTLVHEMVHLWQHHFGKEPTRCYHDRQWAGKMKEVGLHPSDTGAEGGKETGPKVSHYIVPGGPFAVACEKFLVKHGQDFLYQDIWSEGRPTVGKGKGGGEGEGEGEGGGEPKSKGRIKFQCKGCNLNAWAKPSAKLRCDDCNRPLHACESGVVGGDDEEDGED